MTSTRWPPTSSRMSRSRARLQELGSRFTSLPLPLLLRMRFMRSDLRSRKVAARLLERLLHGQGPHAGIIVAQVAAAFEVLAAVDLGNEHARARLVGDVRPPANRALHPDRRV